jgi:hypothetical protein
MARYLVTWEIDYEGTGDPEAAARWAWEILRKPHSTANVFTMVDESGNETKIDLTEIDQAGEDDGCPKCDPGKAGLAMARHLHGKRVNLMQPSTAQTAVRNIGDVLRNLQQGA